MSELFTKQVAKRQFGDAKKQSAGKALIVDDSVTDLVGPYHLLLHLGFEVTVCFDGYDGLKKIEDGVYKIIILDLSMPGLDGRIVIEKVNEHRAEAHMQPLNVIVYTGHEVTPEDFNTLEYVKVIDVWQKPLCVSEIAEKLKTMTAA